MGRLDGKVILVTGTSRGIGKAVAEAFTAEGAQVVGASRTSGCDVSRETDVKKLFAGIRKRFGRLDVLINNAGILTPRKPIIEVTAEEWDTTMAANVRSVFLCTRAALQLMIPKRSGLIINISSGAGKRAAPKWGPYAVSKWAVEGFTKSVADEVRESGVNVVAVNPGGTRTAMRAMAYPNEDPRTLKTPGEVAKFFVSLVAGDISYHSGDSIDTSS
jgi:NAD(P)-dependent dehydrogenase (short-subunit alcohol dehydrogenase family)